MGGIPVNRNEQEAMSCKVRYFRTLEVGCLIRGEGGSRAMGQWGWFNFFLQQLDLPEVYKSNGKAEEIPQPRYHIYSNNLSHNLSPSCKDGSWHFPDSQPAVSHILSSRRLKLYLQSQTVIIGSTHTFAKHFAFLCLAVHSKIPQQESQQMYCALPPKKLLLSTLKYLQLALMDGVAISCKSCS